MSRNLKSDIKSNNEAILHTESNKLESKKDSKNKDKVRFDENGDEIMYEERHNVYILDTIFQVFLFLFSVMLLCVVFYPSEDVIINSLIFLLGFCGVMRYSNILFYRRKNRIYITTQGIGFERRKWFRMQKGFFKFGEVGLVVFDFGITNENDEVFIIYPIGSNPPKRFNLFSSPKKHQKITIQTSICKDKIYDFVTFIRQKTKETLESQGIHISDSELKDKIKDLIYKDI